MVIDLYGLQDDEIRLQFPEVYQHLLTTVKFEREKVFQKSGTKDSEAYARLWWIFGKPRQELRPALEKLNKYLATVDTARHRVFQFLDPNIVCDDKSVIIAADDPWFLGVLQSKVHVSWSLRTGGWLGVGNDSVYVKSKVFDPFPFPDPPESLKAEIRAVAEELDAFRKQRQAEHPKLTLTQMYNVLEKLKAMEAARSASPSSLWGGARGGGVSDTLSGYGASTPLSNSPPQGGRGPVAQHRKKDGDGRDEPGHDGGKVALTPDEERIKDEGLILILKELHERLDRLVFQAYGWPDTLSDEEILERLVALNAERAKEEASGLVRWLRPDYQIPRFAKGAAAAKTGELDLGSNVVAIDRALPEFPKDRLDDSLAVEHALLTAGRAMDAATLARGFKRGGKRIEPRIEKALTSLVRYGRITMTPDGRYLARRAA